MDTSGPFQSSERRNFQERRVAVGRRSRTTAVRLACAAVVPSRSDALTVAVGFNPRQPDAKMTPRRGATPGPRLTTARWAENGWAPRLAGRREWLIHPGFHAS